MKTSISLALASLALLSACGGGSSDAGQPGFTRPTDTFNAQAAWKNVLAANLAATLNGTGSDGLDYALALSLAPGASQAFPPTGTAYVRSVANTALRQNGSLLATGTTETFYDSGFLVAGSRDTATANSTTSLSCDVVDSGSAALPPAAVKIDQADASGALYTASTLPNCNTNAGSGTTTARWSVEYEGGITYFCINTEARDLSAQHNLVASESDCLQIMPSGALGNAYRVSLSTPTFSLVARN